MTISMSRLPSSLRRQREKSAFALRRQKATILIALVAVSGTTLLVEPWESRPNVDWWQGVEAIIGIATLAVAVLLWVGETTENWESSLPKRLKAVYLFEGQPVMVCEDSCLAAETDIRAMAQQMGAQINGGRNLELSPVFDIVSPRTETLPGAGTVRRYEIRMSLSRLPQRVAEIRQGEDDPIAVIRRHIVGGEVIDETVSGYTL